MTLSPLADRAPDPYHAEQVTHADVVAAAARLRPHLPETPLVQHPLFARALGVDAWLKLETAQPTGAFKVRGGINWMARHADTVRACGVVTASTGNHGQSIAFAGRSFGVPVVVYAPRDANPCKVEAMRSMGAQVRLEGADFDESAALASAAAVREGMRFVSTGNEPLLIAGVGTAALEAFSRRRFDAVVVPAGGGSIAAATALVAKAMQPGCETIAVASRQAPATHDSWHAGQHVHYATHATLAEGLAVRESFDLPRALLREHLDDFALVDDLDLIDAMRFLLAHAHQLAEPSGVAGLAYVLCRPERFAGKRVLLPITGANVAYEMLARYLAA